MQTTEAFTPKAFEQQPFQLAADTPRRVLRLLFQSRRLLNPEEPCAVEPCNQCFAPHLEKLGVFIDRQEPIHFVMPAFPAKSPNLQKVLGRLPDMAERAALAEIQAFCDRVSHIYPPGARITICSDGRVFGDLVGVPDEDVTAYRRGLEAMIGNLEASSLDWYGLDNVLPDKTYDQMRATLEREYATPLEVLHENHKTDPAFRSLFNGIHRFMFEDQTILNPLMTRNKVREFCKELAYRVIQRSNAWSELVRRQFPSALRLSIHPQPCHSEKIGFQLLRTPDGWTTPWHSVLLDDGGQPMLVKRFQAEKLHASLVFRADRPSHFVRLREEHS